MRYEERREQVNRLIPNGSLVKLVPKPELPEDVKPYGHIITSLDAYRLYQQTTLDITIFNKGTVGLLVEHASSSNQAVILVQDRLYSIHYQFFEAVKIILPTTTSSSLLPNN